MALISLLILWSSALVLMTAHAEVVMVYTIQRHGEHYNLFKNSTLPERPDIGPTVVPAAERAAYNAGTAFRVRYLVTPSCAASTPSTCLAAGPPNYGGVNRPNVGFSPYNTLVNSSALSRALISGTSFMAGVFPGRNNATKDTYLPGGPQVVPIHSVQDDEDYMIRAFNKCPAFEARLKQWYASPEFKAKEEESKPLRDAIAAKVPGLDTSLAKWRKAYDAFNSWELFGVGDPLPEIDPKTMEQMQELADWAELGKFKEGRAGNLIGGSLLRHVVDAVTAAAEGVTNGTQAHYQLISIMSHYYTQLGLLAALRLDSYPPAAKDVWLSHHIPSRCSLMAFELHANRSSASKHGTGPMFAVRLVSQDGPDAKYRTIPLPCAKAGDVAEELAGAGACTLEAFLAATQKAALPAGAAAWCAACENSATNACQAAALTGAGSGAADGSMLRGAGQSGEAVKATCAGQQHGSGDNGLAWKVAVAAVVSAVGTAALMLGVVGLIALRKRTGWAPGSRPGSSAVGAANGKGAGAAAGIHNNGIISI